MAKTLDAAGVKRLIQEIKGANKNLNTPIPISTENTPESMAQNVRNIADYVEKAKAAGIADVNGMGVTCLIDGENSGVGYLYVTNTQVLICGILAYEDNSVSCISVIDGTYGEQSIVIEGHIGQVTSDMLAEGARKPIILTDDTTEVDEETYQKLLSDDVDVVFNIDGGPLYLNFKELSDNGINLLFGYIMTQPVSAEFPYGYSIIAQIIVTISSATPHKLVLSEPTSVAYNPDEFILKDTLSPVLQEINLTGTDADRKAKLDQFAADWKALTGADDLTGARFVGKFGITDDVERNVTGIMTYSAGDTATEKNDNCFYGICNGYSFSKQKSQIAVKVSCTDGSLHITPLFSHLEAITIKTGNTPDDKAANVAAIEAYVDNLIALGIDITKGYMIPICFSNTELGYVMYHPFSTGSEYTGIVTGPGGASSNIAIEKSGYAYVTTHIQPVESSSLTTTAKIIVPAINEVNALAEKKADKSLNAKSLEAITIYTDNTPEHMQANLDNIAAYEANLQALGVDTTKGCTIPIVCSPLKYCGILFGRGDDYYEGVCNSHSTRVTLGIAINIDGSFYATNNLNTISEYRDLTTIAKKIIPAINEVNALAKGYSTPIELTTETAQNKTAIDARVAAFTAQGISLTNGCCIPVVYKGVYAGNISLINGDWYGLLVKNTNNPADNINIKLSADGTITEGNSAQ